MSQQALAPNAEQQAALDSFARERGRALLQAAPGSGKTTLLLRCLADVDLTHEHVWLAAFSTHVARDLARRTPDHSHLTVATMHALGLQYVRRAVGHTHLWPEKYTHLAQRAATEQDGPPTAQEALATCLEALATRAMLTLTDPKDPAALRAMALEQACDLGTWEQAWPRVAPLIKQGCELARQEGQVAYVDMLYVPHALGLNASTFDVILLDEAQDTSAAQRSLLLRALGPEASVLCAGDPHQACFSFLGADIKAFGQLKDALGARVLTLRTCYRCPHSHIDLANQVYPVLEPAPRARLGTVTDLDVEQAVRELRAGDLVLCRTGGPLVALAYRLLGAGKRVRVLGHDLGPGLRALIAHTRAQPGYNDDEFGLYLGAYTVRAQEDLERAGPAGAMASTALWDQSHALRVIWDTHRPPDLAGLRRRVEELTSENGPGNAIELATVHRAKGKEAQRVFLLRPDLLPHPRASTPTQREQEKNLQFVALTRARQALYFITST